MLEDMKIAVVCLLGFVVVLNILAALQSDLRVRGLVKFLYRKVLNESTFLDIKEIVERLDTLGKHFYNKEHEQALEILVKVRAVQTAVSPEFTIRDYAFPAESYLKIPASHAARSLRREQRRGLIRAHDAAIGNPSSTRR